MTQTAVNSPRISEIAARYARLYTGAIADILDKNGYRNQVLPYYITPFTHANRVAGPAFTGQGYACADSGNNDTEARLKMLDSISPDTVSVWSTGGSADCAHWGEIMSTAVRQRGSTGAVIDGGVRDVDFVNAMDYPVFAKFKCSASSIGRWAIVAWQIPIRIGNTIIHPGDFVFGDTDGVVIVPQAITMDVLVAAEDIFERERGMREELRRGVKVADAFAKYGSL
ncbi:MAG TPA: RraA family protein [Bryobacteraceae bacterium]|nr:RraA family protein [Bryobacteraceae bacterium]